MFCVIQEIQTKKPNKNGHSKELKTYKGGYTCNGKKVEWYSWNYGLERFERPIMKAYRISIHEVTGRTGR